MLSILIPNFNRNITDLLINLDTQAKTEGIIYEILVGDDCSNTSVIQQYKQYETSDSVRVFQHRNRLGRSANRNFLAQNAKYDFLLFIDSNAELRDSHFVKNYLSARNLSPVLVGGIAYSEKPPINSAYLLRWKYGRSREMKSSESRNKKPSQSFISFNFFIRKEVFYKIKFDERLTEYGHEDTLFGFRLKQENVNILHLDNALMHKGLIEGTEFLHKTRKSLENLKYILQILDDDPEFIQEVKLLKTYRLVRRFMLDSVMKYFFRFSRKKLESYLTSHNPKILYFQFYKLSYYCSLPE